MGKLGTYKEDEIAVLRAEPPSGSEADPQDEDENEEGENNPETLTDDDIDDIIEQAKENGFDGIDDEGVIDEDEEDLTPEPQSDDDTESEPTDEEETPEEKKKVEGEDEEEDEKKGEDIEGGEDVEEDPFEPGFEDITEETEEDEQRKLKVRYAQLLSRMQNSQKSLADLTNKYGKKIPSRILEEMKNSANIIQDLKDIKVYED